MRNARIILLTIILIGAIVGSGTYYFMHSKSEKDKKELNSQITTLNNLNTTLQNQDTNNIFDLSTAKVGDKVLAMTIVSVKPFSMTLHPPEENLLSNSNAEIIFSGQADVEGDYNYDDSGFSGYSLTFSVSSASHKNLPVIKGPEDQDQHSMIWFYNEAEAMKLLGITEDVAKKGTARITIKDYVINCYPGEVMNTFSLVSVDATSLYTHKELKYSMTLSSGYVGVDDYGCEGGCGSILTIAEKLADNSYSNSNVKLTFNVAEYTLDQMVANYKKDHTILKESDITIDGVKAKKYEIGGFAAGYHYLAASGKYNLEIDQYPNDMANQKVVDSILSTFKFPK